MIVMLDQVDLLIPAAPKDYNKLPYVIAAARQHIGVQDIHVIAPTPQEIDGGNLGRNVTLHADGDVLPYADRSEIGYRPNWVFQQMLKLSQEVTREWYLAVDADIVVNRPIPLWENGHPVLCVGLPQPIHFQYTNFNQHMLGYRTGYHRSLLSECTLYNRKLARQMFVHAGVGDREGFWRKTVQIVDCDCFPADAEVYGAYVLRQHTWLYVVRPLNAMLCGRYGSHIWSKEEMESELSRMRRDAPQAHLLSLHSWEGTVG